MNLEDFQKLQDELDRKLNPPLFKGILEVQERVNRILDVTSWTKFKPSCDVPSTYKPMCEIPNFSAYTKAFELIEKIHQATSWSDLALVRSGTTGPQNWGEIVFDVNQQTEIKEYQLLPPVQVDNKADSENEVSKESTLIILNETKQIKRIITDVYRNNSLLYTIEPRAFEELIAELLSAQGFDVKLTKQTRDGGYDILAMQYVKGHSPLKYLVECKRHGANNPVGVNIVSRLRDVMVMDNANKGVIVTTSYFSKDAKKIRATTPYTLDFKDKLDVVNWIKEYMKNEYC